MIDTRIEGGDPPRDEVQRVFEEELAADLRTERMLAWKELLAVAIVLVIVLLHELT